jgi:hypothetical protein
MPEILLGKKIIARQVTLWDEHRTGEFSVSVPSHTRVVNLENVAFIDANQAQGTLITEEDFYGEPVSSE